MQFTTKSFVLLLIALSTSLTAMAETYSWSDENGTVNFTEDRSSIPKKYRKKIKLYGDMKSSESTAIQENKGGKVQAPIKDTPSNITSNSASNSSSELYDGKSYDQWKEELTERETVMNQVRSRIEALDSQIKKGAAVRGTVQGLMDERKKEVLRYQSLRAEYDKRIEVGRKAGLKIELK